MRTTLAWPFAAAKWSGVAPEVPTIGAAESRLRSEYLRGSLDALTSAPCLMRRLTTRSLPPAQAACKGRTPSKTEFTGWP